AFGHGLATDQPVLFFYVSEYTHLHTPEGSWQMIFSVVTAPAHRREGCASRVLRQVCADAKAAGRRGVVLTCKERLIGFYARFGFVDEGVSASTHGDVVWHQMRLTF
ncbi:GNAT family N-acetyltransferase, partial [Faecalibacterium sp.]|uniref:GNAT family N-acetyltransferase n=1 Tax=Faecalibacterium sp. TaxID=1971605 RepID=UPI00402745D8